jgi:putative transposase
MDAPCIQQAYRFALAPSPEQEAFLGSCCGASRFWFNQGLALVKERLDRRAAGEDVNVPWSYTSLCSEVARLKDTVCPWRREVVVGSMQAGLEQLGRALQNYSQGKQMGRRIGFPRFRARGRCHESVIFQRPRLPDGRHVMLDRRLGPLRTKESLRKLTRLLERDENARMLRSTIQRTGGGWVISFTVERSPKQRRARHPEEVVGVDVGLARLATLSTTRRSPTPGRYRGVCASCGAFNVALTVSAAPPTPATTYRTDGQSRPPAAGPGRRGWFAPRTASGGCMSGLRTYAASRPTNSRPT